MFIERSKEEERGRRERGEGEEGAIKWFAGRREGECRSNVRAGDVNAVTWGVFGGKEIITTTMIEEMSFKAWKVRSPSPSDDKSLIRRVAGGSIRNLARMVSSLPDTLALSQAYSAHRRYTMARQRRSSRLQKRRRTLEIPSRAGAVSRRGDSGRAVGTQVRKERRESCNR